MCVLLNHGNPSHPLQGRLEVHHTRPPSPRVGGEGLEDVGNDTIRVTLNGETRQEVALSPQDRHFADIDVLGTDFFNHMEARFRVDYKGKTCALEWDDT